MIKILGRSISLFERGVKAIAKPVTDAMWMMPPQAEGAAAPPAAIQTSRRTEAYKRMENETAAIELSYQKVFHVLLGTLPDEKREEIKIDCNT